MTKAKMRQLYRRRVRLNEQQRKLNAEVRAADPRAHHQSCTLGGLWTGLAADISGSPCWCGAWEEDERIRAERAPVPA